MTYIPYLGIIEGFYGRTWPHDERLKYARFLSENGHSFSIYAPKNDPFLRKSWFLPWPESEKIKIEEWAETHRAHGVDIGFGLSPFEIYLDFSARARDQLKTKLEEINQFKPNLLCLLFDDMKGDVPQLAELQTEITHFVAEHCSAQRIIMCPTYYSFDPVLEKVFGKMPDRYFETLGQGLDPEIEIFWTGPKVCSRSYPKEHLKKITALFERPVFLWDNYPVNDGAKISKFLHLKPFAHAGNILTKYTSGHAANPMNQSFLSRIPLSTLAQAYKTDYDLQLSFEEACVSHCGKPLGGALIEDVELFQEQGLDIIDIDALIQKYKGYDGPFALEIVAWLKGEYAFDPACLTD